MSTSVLLLENKYPKEKKNGRKEGRKCWRYFDTHRFVN
jgi:hypothetical protein